ncbi:XRE family transcriptional regulator [Nakamurella silvestris]|nr:XRE family transcriptional regulator [Nakamurella silvestris]
MTRGSVRGFRPSYLRNARRRANLSHEDLGLLASVSPSTIGHWESSRRAPSPEALMAVAQSLNMVVADLAPVAEGDLLLSDLRNRMGLTQAAAAAAIGISHQALGSIERGARPPTVEIREKIATVYGSDSGQVGRIWQRTHDARVVRPDPRPPLH